MSEKNRTRALFVLMGLANALVLMVFGLAWYEALAITLSPAIVLAVATR